MVKNAANLISVIIPCYNPSFHYLKQAIESVLAQSYPNWELVLINDGSDKKISNDIEKFIEGLNDKRISMINLDKNYGPSVAKNKGIEESKGEIITFLDADDLHLPWYYKDLKENFNKYTDCSISMSHCYFYINQWRTKKFFTNKNFQLLFEEKSSPDIIFEKVKKERKPIIPIISFRKRVFEKIRFCSDLRLSEDLDLTLQIMSNNELLRGLYILPKVGYVYRMYPSRTRLTHRKDLMFCTKELLINKYQNEVDLFAHRYIKYKQDNHDIWRFSRFLNEYLNNGSILRYLSSVYLNFGNLRDIVDSIKVLIRTILTYKLMIPVFGFDLKYLKMVISPNGNKFNKVKILFQDYLNSNQDDTLTKFYANKIYKEIF